MKGKTIREAEYKKIKALIDFKVPKAEVGRIAKVSSGTVWRIGKSKDFAEFQKGYTPVKKRVKIETQEPMQVTMHKLNTIETKLNLLIELVKSQEVHETKEQPKAWQKFF